jgi:hypothetical protein
MGSFKGDTNSRRIDRALQHVSKPWFPMNPDVLKRVREGLEQKTYESNMDALLEELKSDFALFTFVVKELSQKAVLSEAGKNKIGNPIELIRWGGSSGIGEVLAEQQKIPNIHSLHWSEPFQVQRLRETAIIASTASVLSEKKNLDPELGFSRGVIREIGLNLIAWNYPSVYTKVLNSLTAEQNLDDELAKELGFTPALLGTRLFRPDLSANPDQAEIADPAWASYDELCEVGEVLARAENPETYPAVEKDWQKAQDVLKGTLGDNAIDVIRAKTIETSKSYQKSVPEVFADIASFDPGKQIRRFKRVSRAIDERDLKYCSEAVKEALKNLYSEMSDESVNKAIVGRLIKDVFPEAGFTGGCVFVVDPTSLSLKPRTLIGNVQMRQISNVALEPGDPAVSALSSTQPVVKNGDGTENASVAGIYSALGSRKKIGVLYLETSQKNQVPPSDETMGVFNVLKKALSDALLLE